MHPEPLVRTFAYPVLHDVMQFLHEIQSIVLGITRRTPFNGWFECNEKTRDMGEPLYACRNNRIAVFYRKVCNGGGGHRGVAKERNGLAMTHFLVNQNGNGFSVAQRSQ